MSDVFLRELNLPAPDHNLAVGSGSHAQQTAQIMLRLEPILLTQNPDLVMVYGDVNSTMAAALVAAKLNRRIAHVEAGLRSYDRTMPEEINRVVTDQVADLLFTPSTDADENLLREGVARAKIHCVGNVMIDTLVTLLPVAKREATLEGVPERYALVTLHRSSNVDDAQTLTGILTALNEVSEQIAVIFPVHPRTKQRLDGMAFQVAPGVGLRPPLSYLEFLALQQRATVVITDSGGIQEETTFLRIPCLTMRETTERPITVTLGTNIVVGQNFARLRAELERILAGQGKKGEIPPLWDGRAAQRIAAVVMGLEAGPVELRR